MLTLPNLLTLGRIAAIPALLATFYWDTPATRWIACAIFAVAAVTDFFDGYLARRLNQVSAIGRFLDPIADKLLVAALLLFLAAFERFSTLGLIPAVVILCREILVSGLREYLAEIRIGMPVMPLAKWKTTVQLIALPVLIVGDGGLPGYAVILIGEILLWVAGLLTLITGYAYLKAGVAYMRAADKGLAPQAATSGARRPWTRSS